MAMFRSSFELELVYMRSFWFAWSTERVLVCVYVFVNEYLYRMRSFFGFIRLMHIMG